MRRAPGAAAAESRSEAFQRVLRAREALCRFSKPSRCDRKGRAGPRMAIVPITPAPSANRRLLSSGEVERFRRTFISCLRFPCRPLQAALPDPRCLPRRAFHSVPKLMRRDSASSRSALPARGRRAAVHRSEFGLRRRAPSAADSTGQFSSRSNGSRNSGGALGQPRQANLRNSLAPGILIISRQRINFIQQRLRRQMSLRRQAA